MVRHLETIYSSEGPPLIIQCVNGKELYGAVALLCKCLNIKIICSSPYHPQCQGKTESSHVSWKKYINHDLRKQTKTTWFDSLHTYCMLRNEEIHSSIKLSPFEETKKVQKHRVSFSTYICSVKKIRSQEKKKSNSTAKNIIKRHLSSP